MPDFERSKENLHKLIDWASDKDQSAMKNEATTRLHLIDTLLFECLGWDKHQAIAEDRLDDTYADYVLGQPTRKLVVEAKREGSYFDLPAGFKRRVMALPSLFDGNPNVEAAIRQAVGYAQERGIAVATVCNGSQIVAVLASRQDGVSPFAVRALVFTSLKDMQANFRQLWDNLSEPGIDDRSILHTLRGRETPPPPEKLSTRITNYPGYRIRNHVQADLQILGDLFLQDLALSEELEEEFLRDTYCTSGALSQYALVTKELLKTRYSVLFEQESEITATPAADRDGIAPQLRSDIVASSLARRPIVLLGDVGVGKTMFIRRLIHVDAKDVLEDRSVVLYVDFGSEPAVSQALPAHVRNSIKRQLLENYGIDVEERNFVRGVYYGELLRFDRSIYGELKDVDPEGYRRERFAFLQKKLDDEDEHLRSSLEHVVKGQSRQVVIFLDNIDQRPLHFQEEVFIISQALASRWPATVFVSLRPKTFFTSRARGSIAAYQPRVFTIAPPRIDLVIKRRVSFALRQLERTGRLAWFPEGVAVHADTLEQYLRVLLNSFDTNTGLVEFIDNVSGGSVRQALDFVGTFVGSGHVDTEKILSRYQTTGRYTIGVHEFIRAVIFGDFQYYEPLASPITNVFDISSSDLREHFLMPIVLTEVQTAGDMGSEEGFVTIDSIYAKMQSIGFDEMQTKWTLDRAFDSKLLDMSPRFEGAPASCRITTVGAYTVQRLVRFFTYVDAVLIDTPIVDATFRERIGDVWPIAERVQRAEWFRSYLNKAWNGLSEHDAAFSWPSVTEALRDDIWQVGRRVDPERWPT